MDKLAPVMPNKLMMEGAVIKTDLTSLDFKKTAKPDTKLIQDLKSEPFWKVIKTHGPAIKDKVKCLEQNFDPLVSKQPQCIYQSLPFFGYINDFSLSVVLASGWCLKYALSIEDVVKAEFLIEQKTRPHLGIVTPSAKDKLGKTIVEALKSSK